MEAAGPRFWTRGSLFFVHWCNSWKATSKITLAPSSLQTLLVNDRPLFQVLHRKRVQLTQKSELLRPRLPSGWSSWRICKTKPGKSERLLQGLFFPKAKTHSSLVGPVGNTLHEGREDPKNEIFVQLWRPSLSHTWLQPSHFCGAALSFPFTTCFLSWCDKEK